MDKIVIIKSADDKVLLPSINLKFSCYNDIPLINETENDMVKCYKNKIDDNRDWDKGKKLSNEFELIHLPNKNYKSESISKYEPLSRSYFKLWEILTDLELISKENINCKKTYVTLCEGPGGFIEALVNWKKMYTTERDDIYAITLKSTDKDIPGWKKSNIFLSNNSNVKISYGEDNTGNIYRLENMKYFFKEFNLNRDVELITADGGFDFSQDFNNQETLSYQIIFCEIVMALSCQKIGGSFICKFFDMYYEMSYYFITLLGACYDEVLFCKPLTSRPANSEKYIVCRGFKGIEETYLKKLYIIVKNWELIKERNMFVNRVFDSKIPIVILENLKQYNKDFCDHQIHNIKNTLEIIESHSSLKYLNDIVSTQCKSAIKWCKEYNIEINENSNFIKNT